MPFLRYKLSKGLIMLKYIFIIIVGFACYKTFFSTDTKSEPSWSEVYSDEHKFQVQFPHQPKEEFKQVNLPGLGKIELTSYIIRSPELTCTVIISDYKGQAEVLGSVYDVIDVARRDLLKGFGGSITKEDYIYNQNVSGYEFYMLTNNNKLLQSRVYKYENKAYNLTCQYKENEVNRNKVN
ncbi:hypothetical protein, partial [Shewanella sp. 10N.286.52.B9]